MGRYLQTRGVSPTSRAGRRRLRNQPVLVLAAKKFANCDGENSHKTGLDCTFFAEFHLKKAEERGSYRGDGSTGNVGNTDVAAGDHNRAWYLGCRVRTA
jgi:hypothetical protein